MEEVKQLIDISQFSTEQLANIQAQLEAKKKEDEKKKEADREALAKLEDEAVLAIVREAEGLANNIGAFKLATLTKFNPLMDMKVELAKASSEQKSFTFSDSKKKKKVVISYNDAWKCDDGIHVCIEKAKQWMQEVSASSDQAAAIVRIVEKLIASRDGSYSTDGIWDLINAAQDIDSPLLKEAADAGRRSLYKEKTSVSVRVYVNEKTGWEQLPLSATKA